MSRYLSSAASVFSGCRSPISPRLNINGRHFCKQVIFHVITFIADDKEFTVPLEKTKVFDVAVVLLHLRLRVALASGVYSILYQ